MDGPDAGAGPGLAYLADGTLPYPQWLKYRPRTFTDNWNRDFGFLGPTAQDLADGNQGLRKAIDIVAAMRRAGVKLMAGTDANGPFPALIPGISLHQELRLFVRASTRPRAPR